MRIALIAALVLLSACDKPKSATRAAGRGKGAFSAICANPVLITSQKDETKIEKGMAEVQGTWELESVTWYLELATDGNPGTLTTQYKNNAAAVICHNSDPAKDSTLRTILSLPQIMNADNKTILAEITLKALAERGVTSQEVKVVTKTSPLPVELNEVREGLESQLVKTKAGKLIIRFIQRSTADNGKQNVLAAEAVYRLKR